MNKEDQDEVVSNKRRKLDDNDSEKAQNYNYDSCDDIYSDGWEDTDYDSGRFSFKIFGFIQIVIAKNYICFNFNLSCSKSTQNVKHLQTEQNYRLIIFIQGQIGQIT